MPRIKQDDLYCCLFVTKWHSHLSLPKHTHFKIYHILFFHTIFAIELVHISSVLRTFFRLPGRDTVSIDTDYCKLFCFWLMTEYTRSINICSSLSTFGFWNDRGNAAAERSRSCRRIANAISTNWPAVDPIVFFENIIAVLGANARSDAQLISHLRNVDVFRFLSFHVLSICVRVKFCVRKDCLFCQLCSIVLSDLCEHCRAWVDCDHHSQMLWDKNSYNLLFCETSTYEVWIHEHGKHVPSINEPPATTSFRYQIIQFE